MPVQEGAWDINSVQKTYFVLSFRAAAAIHLAAL